MTKSYIKKEFFANYYYKDEARTILHREDGPAIEHVKGAKYWYLNGLLHRMGGPAVEYSGGMKHWYLNDKEYSEEEHKRLVKMINFL